MRARSFDLEWLWRTAVDRCDGGRLVVETFADLSLAKGPVHVLSLGKAAGSMAAGAVEVLGERAGRVVIAAASVAGAPKRAEVHLGDHPHPGPASFAAGRALLRAASEMRSSGQKAMVLVSGGGSALCEVPAECLLEEDLTLAHRALVSSGAPIEAMNRIRSRLSAIKGGGLAKALGASLAWEGVLVDIPSGDPSVVASGPCRSSSAAGAGETPGGVDRRVLATPRTLAEIAAELVREKGERAVRLRDDAVSGETVEALGEEILGHLSSGEGVWVATGEVSLPLPPEGPGGRGGRAQHLALWVLKAASERLPAGRRWGLLCAGSDGRDGAGGAGALVGDGCAVSTEEMQESLALHASGELHRKMGTLLEEHPPRTNLTDLYVAWAA